MKTDTMTLMRMRKRLEVCGKYRWFKGKQYRRMVLQNRKLYGSRVMLRKYALQKGVKSYRIVESPKACPYKYSLYVR